MSEINNNLDIGKGISPIPMRADEGKTDPQVPQKGEGSEKAISDFSNQPAEVLGRSQVQKANPVDKDISFAIKNPEKVEKANQLFEFAYNQAMGQGLTSEQAYSQAAGIMDAYVKEFS